MIAIITDSTISITRAQAQELGLTVVPAYYSINGVPYEEGYADEHGDFESRIFADPERAKTSQPPVSAFVQAFSELIEEGYDVLCLCISSRLSGTYSSACLAASEVAPKRIAVVDSLTTSGGLWLLAREARALAEQGMPLFEIAERMQALREKTGIIFSVDDMAALRRSGRLGVVPQSVGTVLNIRPILMCVRGAVVARGLARGTAERIRLLLQRVPPQPKAIILHHLCAPALALSLLQAVEKRFPDVLVQSAKLGPVLGIHLGGGTVGLAWITD